MSILKCLTLSMFFVILNEYQLRSSLAMWLSADHSCESSTHQQLALLWAFSRPLVRLVSLLTLILNWLRALLCLLCPICTVLLAPQQQQQQQQHAAVPRRQQLTCRAAATAEGELADWQKAELSQ
jgi:hypothetical protein